MILHVGRGVDLVGYLPIYCDIHVVWNNKTIVINVIWLLEVNCNSCFCWQVTFEHVYEMRALVTTGWLKLHESVF